MHARRGVISDTPCIAISVTVSMHLNQTIKDLLWIEQAYTQCSSVLCIVKHLDRDPVSKLNEVQKNGMIKQEFL